MNQRRTGIFWVLLLMSFGAFAPCIPSAAAPIPELHKRPPQDISQGAQWAAAAARERFPELFRQKIAGRALITLVFGPDGKNLFAQKQIFAEGVQPTGVDVYAAARAAGAERDDVAYGGDEDLYTIGPWLDTVNADRLLVVYAVLRWRLDPARSSLIVRRAVHARFPELFVTTDFQSVRRYATVFMKDDGTIALARTEVWKAGAPISPLTFAPDRFTQLGAEPSTVGRRGMVDEPGVVIAYAWPRRPDDDAAEVEDLHVPMRPSRDDTRDDRAIVERYFPHAAQVRLSEGERRWILLSHDGSVWATGDGAYDDSPQGVLVDIEGRFPGVRLMGPAGLWGSVSPRGINCLGDTREEWVALSVSCVWLAADSPVTTPDRVDLSKRADVFLTATMTAEFPLAIPVALRFDTAKALRPPFDFVQVRAHEVDVDHADITVRVLPRQGGPAVAEKMARITYGERKAVQMGAAALPITNVVLLASRVPPP